MKNYTCYNDGTPEILFQYPGRTIPPNVMILRFKNNQFQNANLNATFIENMSVSGQIASDYEVRERDIIVNFQYPEMHDEKEYILKYNELIVK